MNILGENFHQNLLIIAFPLSQNNLDNLKVLMEWEGKSSKIDLM